MNCVLRTHCTHTYNSSLFKCLLIAVLNVTPVIGDDIVNIIIQLVLPTAGHTQPTFKHFTSSLVIYIHIIITHKYRVHIYHKER
mgnify:CR=1 FL=1